jgi:GTP cyclohydrolase II
MIGVNAMTQYSTWCILPTKYGDFRMYDTGNEMINLLSYGPIEELVDPVLFRMHSSCIASEVFGALDCDCADQLDQSMKMIAENGSGIVMHLHQEGRGQGLSKKIEAISIMQKEQLDTVEAFDRLHLAHDIRDYSLASNLLSKLGIQSVRLITNNPRKQDFLLKHRINIFEVIQTNTEVRPENREYLYSKKLKLNHTLPIKD